MRIALVFPPFYLEPMYNLPPLGLANLATALKGSAHETFLLDFPLAIRRGTIKMGNRIYDECARRIMSEDPDVVGISVQCTTYPPALQIAKKLRSYKPSLKIVFGGHGSVAIDEKILAGYPWIDAIVRGEGEITFAELVESYDRGLDGEGINGVTYRKGEEIVRNEDRELILNLDDLPLTDYSLLPSFSEYRDACQISRSIAILEVGRGCPYKCVYCSQSIMWRRQTRTFSVDRLIAEMRHLRDDFGAECFLLAYDQFTAKRSFVEEFCRKVLEKGLHDIPWYCISRLDSVDARLLGLMREAGCESMCYGIDSGSRKTLSFIRKQIDPDILYQRVQETTDQGIIPTLSYVIGFPEEEKEDIDATLELVLRTSALGNTNPLIQMATILPGTDLYLKYAERLAREVDTYFSLGIEFEEGKRLLSDEAMITADPSVFCSFYNLPCPGRSLGELNAIASSFHLIANFYPRSFLLLSMERKESISDLFFRWIEWLNELTERNEQRFSPHDLYMHFGTFAREILQNKGNVQRPHILEVVKYETLALEAGKWDASLTHFHVDLGRIGEFKPRRSDKIVIGEFEWNMTEIIGDLKAGIFRDNYPSEKAFLVFLQVRDQLQVKEINDFGRDFLQLCDGNMTLKMICDQLSHQYGRDMIGAQFFKSCVEAVELLGQMKMLQSDQPQ